MNLKPDAEERTEPARRPYHRPELRQYGSLSTITLNVDKAGRIDGGKGQSTRTSG
jgi:hypothetical protein